MADYNSSYTGTQIDNAVGAGLAVRSSSGLVKSNGSGSITAAIPNSDYLTPLVASASGALANYYRTTSGIPVSGLTVNIDYVQAGTGDPSPTNVRAISGWTGANISHTGANLVDLRNITLIKDSSHRTLTVEFAAPIPAGDYTVRVKVTSQTGTTNLTRFNFQHDTTNLAYVDAAAGQTGVVTKSFTVTDTITRCYMYMSSSNPADSTIIIESIQLMRGTDTSDNPYQGGDTAISWQTEAGTVYKGTLNVPTGVLTVTHKLATFDGTEGWGGPEANGNIYLKLSNTNKMADRASGALTTRVKMNLLKTGDTGEGYGYVSAGGYLNCKPPDISTLSGWTTLLGTTNLQVYYPLETSLTYQLSGTAIASLFGENNIWADTGDVQVSFSQDIKDYIDAEILGAIGGSY